MTNSANGIQRKVKVKGQKPGTVTSFKCLEVVVIKGWTGMDFTSSTRAAENRTRWKGIGGVSRRLSNIMGQNRIE